MGDRKALLSSLLVGLGFLIAILLWFLNYFLDGGLFKKERLENVADTIKGIVADKAKLEFEQALKKLKPEVGALPTPIIYKEEKVGGNQSSAGRYLILGTVEKLKGDILRIESKERLLVGLDNQTLFVCMEFADKDKDFKDYRKLYIDLAQFVPFGADERTIQKLFGYYAYGLDEIRTKILKNSWVYAFVPEEKWNKDKTASLVFLTYCYY